MMLRAAFGVVVCCAQLARAESRRRPHAHASPGHARPPPRHATLWRVVAPEYDASAPADALDAALARRLSGDRPGWYVRQEDGASMPTLQKSAKTGLVSPSSVDAKTVPASRREFGRRPQAAAAANASGNATLRAHAPLAFPPGAYAASGAAAAIDRFLTKRLAWRARREPFAEAAAPVVELKRDAALDELDALWAARQFGARACEAVATVGQLASLGTRGGADLLPVGPGVAASIRGDDGGCDIYRKTVSSVARSRDPGSRFYQLVERKRRAHRIGRRV